MRLLTFWLLWLFVFSLPFEPFFVFGPLGTLSRVVGMLVVALGFLTKTLEGSIRRPGIVVCLTASFILMAVMSLFWTISYDATISQVLTYVQLLGVVCVIWEFARRMDDLSSLMVAYGLGAYVSVASALRNFSGGMSALNGRATGRYAAMNFDPNEFGLTLALAIPMAWYLFLTRRGRLRFVWLAYVPIASATILLTASRAAFLACVISLAVIPFTTIQKTLGSMLRVSVIALLTAGTAAVVVPPSSWERILTARTARDELIGDVVMGRGAIWNAGLQVFQDRPLLGYGAGSFKNAVEPIVGSLASHNVLVAVLVEQGLTGFLIFAALLATCAGLVSTLTPLQRKVWTILACTWLTGAVTLDWQYHKITWFLVACLAAMAAAKQSDGHVIVKPREIAMPIPSKLANREPSSVGASSDGIRHLGSGHVDAFLSART